MKVVLDTNVFISGIFWSGPPYLILEAWQNKKINIAITPEILNEYTRVGNLLQRKYKDIDITPFIDLIAIYSEMYQPDKVSSDADDDKFIACALSADAKIIITGDVDLLMVDGYAGIKINPTEVC